MTSKGQTKRLPAAEHSKHADRSDYLAEAMVLGLRRSTSDEARRDSLERLVAAARARTTAAQKPRGSDD